MSELSDSDVMTPELSDDQVMGSVQAPASEAFGERVTRGAAFMGSAQKVGRGTASSIVNTDWDALIEHGIINDPYTGRPGMVHGRPLVSDKQAALDHALSSDLRNAIEGMKKLPQQAFEQSENLRTQGDFDPGPIIGAATFGIGGIGEFGPRGAKFATPAEVAAEYGYDPLRVTVHPQFGRAAMSPDRPAAQEIGAMPTHADFESAANVVKPPTTPDAVLKDNLNKWVAGYSGGAKVDLLPETVERFGEPLLQDTTFYRGDTKLRPPLGRTNETTSVSDFSGGISFSMARNEGVLEDIAAREGGRLPVSEIVVPAGTRVLDVGKHAPAKAEELERMLPPGNFVKVGERREPFNFAGEKGEHLITTYQFEPAGTEYKLRELWQDRGIHPAEAAHDAQSDAFLKHDLQSKTPIGFGTQAIRTYRDLLAENEGQPIHSLGAAATEPKDLPPSDIPFSQQPAPPAGRIAAAFSAAAEKAFDIGRDIQMLTSPMATGTTESMAVAKDFANAMRRNRWEWSRVDTDLTKRFNPEQRERMWNAADEESVARQLGESREHQGLVTLEPAERAAVDDLHTRAQVAWLRARDIGLVEGEGLPAYTPRMVINTANALEGEGSISLNGIGRNLRTTSANLKQRKHLTAEETEAAAKAKYGTEAELARDIRTLPLATAKLEDAIAGRTLINNIKEIGDRTGDETIAIGAIPEGSEHKWFTMQEHPSFRTWRPKFKEEDGKVVAVKDADGNAVFEKVPIYVRSDFEGPLRAVLTTKSGELYKSMMSLKGKTMSLIMNSPMIHNAVEFGRAFPAMPLKVGTLKVYFEGYRAKNNIPLMREAIDSGLVPIGKRFFKQDIDSIMEAPDLTPGRSWTAKALGETVGRLPQKGMTTEEVMAGIKRDVDKAGDFWHNTLLWDRIADLQMGLYVNFRSGLIAKGTDTQTASRIAAHLANRYAGALPKEAMSDGATKIANLMLFSRTFTIGNLGVMKDMLTGMPKDVLAQIERDAGFRKGSISEEGIPNGPEVDAVQYAKTMARRKAIATVVMDIGLMYVGNSILQSAFNIMLGDSTLSQEMHGYVKRARDVMNEVNVHPLSLLRPFDLAEKLSATGENEPGRRDRIKIGYAKDGTAIYARNPVGKIGEEFIGYLTSPIDMLKRKEGTIARPVIQTIMNDRGFGRKIYDPNADTPAKYAGNIWAIVQHFAKSQIPEGQLNAFSDTVKGEGDPKVNALQAFGPVAGVTFSKGAPGGPAVGELYKAREMHDFQVQQALPDIRKQMLRGDMAGARQKMNELGIPPGLQRFYQRTTTNPSTRLSGKALQDFYRYATPAQRQRMENLRGTSPLAAPQ